MYWPDLRTAGSTVIPGEQLDAYYASVEAAVKSWNNEKPTDLERTALALTRMGKDITNVGGVNLCKLSTIPIG